MRFEAVSVQPWLHRGQIFHSGSPEGAQRARANMIQILRADPEFGVMAAEPDASLPDFWSTEAQEHSMNLSRQPNRARSAIHGQHNSSTIVLYFV